MSSIAQVDYGGRCLGDPDVRVGVVNRHIDFRGSHIVNAGLKTHGIAEGGRVRDLLYEGRQRGVDQHAVVERGHGQNGVRRRKGVGRATGVGGLACETQRTRRGAQTGDVVPIGERHCSSARGHDRRSGRGISGLLDRGGAG